MQRFLEKGIADRAKPGNPARGTRWAGPVSLALSVTLLFPAAARSHNPDAASEERLPEEIIVFGRNEQLIGTAQAASEGSVGGADLLVRPMLRVAEVLEAVPGMVAVQHSGSGKANQYFLRGFNLDHGTDFSLHIDGVPWNLRSHGHGQGYLDVNGLIPEVIDAIDYRKGPYHAETGDFSLAGSGYIRTIDRLDAAYVSFEAGQYGWSRVAAGGTVPLARGELTVLGEYKAYDGPWQLGENLEHFAVWSKYLRATGVGEIEFTLSGYGGDWRPTEQIPERAIGSEVCPDAYCTLDPTATGNTSRWIAALQATGETWDGSAYLQFYDWHMQSNPTYDLQINQFDRRWTVGGHYKRTMFEAAAWTVTIGGEARYDDIGPVGVDEYNAGQFAASISDNGIREASLSTFADLGWAPFDDLHLAGGLRGDHYEFDVSGSSSNSFTGTETDDLLSPKLGAAWAVSDKVELYANWGRGFHSNDARGVVNRESPVPGLARGTGYEIGGRLEWNNLRMTAVRWWLDLDSELIFVGDSNSVEPKGGSERNGYELTAFWRLTNEVAADAVFTSSEARYTDNPEGVYVEGAVERSGQIGVSLIHDPWEASLRLRYLGPYALTADNSRRADAETTVYLRGAYTFGNVTLYGELFNLLDDDSKDIVYYYPAHVTGFDPSGLTSDDIDCEIVNCRMSRVMEPRSLRIGVRYYF